MGQNATAVGRTSEIWGSLTIAGTTVTKGSFTVNMASVVSDQSERNAHFDGSDHGCRPVPHGHTDAHLADRPRHDPDRRRRGALQRHGRPRHARRDQDGELHRLRRTVDGEIDVLADITDSFREWNISNPSIGGFVTTAKPGRSRFCSTSPRAPETRASTSSGSSGATGGGGPITVPSTTVPPLTVPSG